MATTKINEAMAALRRIAFLVLPEYELMFKHKIISNAEKLEEKVIKPVKRPGRFVVQKRRGVSVSKSKRYSWTGVNIERDVQKLVTRGGRHTFLTHMMEEDKIESFNKAICNRAKKVLDLNPDGTKRWRTTRDKDAKTITLYVTKPQDKDTK
jgi:hypothetical protein